MTVTNVRTTQNILSFLNYELRVMQKDVRALLLSLKPLAKKVAKGPFKFYVTKEVSGWGQKMAISDDLQYCKSSF